MPLTPLDIQNKEFRTALRGYDRHEVDRFIEKVLNDYEEIYKDNLALTERLRQVNDRLEQYTRMEDTLKETMVLAQKTAEEVKKAAQHEADLLCREAKAKGDEILGIANEKVRQALYRRDKLLEEIRKFQIHWITLLQSQIRYWEETDLAPEEEGLDEVACHVE